MSRLTWVFVLMAILGTSTAIVIHAGQTARDREAQFLGRCIGDSGLTVKQCEFLTGHVKVRVR